MTSLTERLLTYALGRELEHYDQPVVRSVVRQAAADGTTLAALVQAIVASDAFRKRIKSRGREPRRWRGRRADDDGAHQDPGECAAAAEASRLEPAATRSASRTIRRCTRSGTSSHRIPRGSVSTYGDVAREAGLPGRARQAGYALKHMPAGMHLPWHRVVGAGGRIVFPPGSSAHREQTRRLKSEGIKVESGRVARVRACSVARSGTDRPQGTGNDRDPVAAERADPERVADLDHRRARAEFRRVGLASRLREPRACLGSTFTAFQFGAA